MAFLDKMKVLHPRQAELLRLLKENLESPLTIRELQHKLNISSPSVVHHHIVQLEKRGFLRRNPMNPADYQVLTDEPEKKIAYLNLYGLAQCGPNGTFLDGNPIDRIPISTSLLSFPAREAFLVRAKGKSMSPRINENDLVVARKTNEVLNSQIMICVNDGVAVIKRINVQRKSGNSREILLESLNPTFHSIMAASDFRAEGLVKGVISRIS